MDEAEVSGRLHFPEREVQPFLFIPKWELKERNL